MAPTVPGIGYEMLRRSAALRADPSIDSIVITFSPKFNAASATMRPNFEHCSYFSMADSVKPNTLATAIFSGVLMNDLCGICESTTLKCD